MTASYKNGAAILWFKHDLRIDDHPGLVAASKSRVLLPLYVFDHRILSREFHIYVCVRVYNCIWHISRLFGFSLNIGLENGGKVKNGTEML